MIQNKVWIDKESHRYWDRAGNEFTSLSRVRDCVKEGFNSKLMAEKCAGKKDYVGMDAEQVKAQWAAKGKRAADHGTRIHDAIEEYTKEFTIKPENEDLRSMLEALLADYRPYDRIYAEQILYSPSYEAKGTRIAGTTDRILITSTRSGITDIEDYKTNIDKGIQFYSDRNKYMLGPMSHLQDCNFNDYALQISIYALMYEELTGKKIRSCWIRFIPPENPLHYRRIPIPYLKLEAYAVLERFHQLKHSPKSEQELEIFEPEF